MIVISTCTTRYTLPSEIKDKIEPSKEQRECRCLGLVVRLAGTDRKHKHQSRHVNNPLDVICDGGPILKTLSKKKGK